GAVPDLMRGEESQLAALLERLPPGRHRACLPGTHSKWVTIRDGRIDRIHTAMTGELYGLLRRHSLVGALMPGDDEGFDSAAFDAGLARSAEASGLLHHLFGVRAAGLAGRYGDGLPSYLSGLLLGHELRGGLAFDGACPGPVHLVGSERLLAAYARALAAVGAQVQRQPGGLAAHGLHPLWPGRATPPRGASPAAAGGRHGARPGLAARDRAAAGTPAGGRERLHPGVVGPPTALWRHPDDVLGRVLDVAGLAVHAVGEVDLQAHVLALAHEFVHGGRAVARLGTGVLLEVHLDRHRGVLQREVAGLVLVVDRARQEHRAQAIEGEHAVRLRIRDALVARGRLQAGVVGPVPVQRPRRIADAEPGQQPLLDAGHQRGQATSLLEPLLEVLRLAQLGVQPARFERLRVLDQLVARPARTDRRERGLRREHAGLDRGVAALDPAGVEEARLAADHRAAREHQLRQRQQSAGGDRARAVADALATLQVPADR